MRSTQRFFRLAAAALVVAAGGGFPAPPVAAEDSSQAEYEFLFVQTSTSGRFDGTKLTLENVGPTVLFTDRPQRVTGHMSTSHFVSQWGVGEDSFREDPPNAALSMYSKDALETAVVEIANPTLEGKTLAYDVVVLDGEVPPRFGESSLFIDILGRGMAFLGGAAVGSAAAHSKDQSQAQTVAQPTHTYTAAPPATSPECTAAQKLLLNAQGEEQIKAAEEKVRVICGSS